MKSKQKSRSKSRSIAAAMQRKRRNNQAMVRARRKRRKSHAASLKLQKHLRSEVLSAPLVSARQARRVRGFGDLNLDNEFEVDGIEMSARVKAVSKPEPGDRDERRKRRRIRGFGDILVDKEMEVDADELDAGELDDYRSFNVADHLDEETLHNRLILSPVGMAQRFIKDVLKAQILYSGSHFVSAQRALLQNLYTVAIVIDNAEPVRRSALLRELGCEPDPKNIFLAICNVAIPVPMVAHLGNVTRKMAQNRNSDYGRAMRGAQILGIATYEFAHQLNLKGGIQALAGVAREWDRRRREETVNRSLTDDTKALEGGDKSGLDRGFTPSIWAPRKTSTSPKRRFGRAREHASALLWKRIGPAERMDEWALKVTELMAERVIDYERPFIAILVPYVDGFSASVNMLAAQEYPFAIPENIDDVLYDIIHEMSMRRR